MQRGWQFNTRHHCVHGGRVTRTVTPPATVPYLGNSAVICGDSEGFSYQKAAPSTLLRHAPQPRAQSTPCPTVGCAQAASRRYARGAISARAPGRAAISRERHIHRARRIRRRRGAAHEMWRDPLGDRRIDLRGIAKAAEGCTRRRCEESPRHVDESRRADLGESRRQGCDQRRRSRRVHIEWRGGRPC